MSNTQYTKIDLGVEPANCQRYTLDGSDVIEARIDADQELIGKAVRQLMPGSELCAVVIMGGYGRGEGGYLWVDDEPAPYNDYDYFIVVQNMSAADVQAINPKVQALAKELEKQVGIEVDFAFLHKEKLASLAPALIFTEMSWGHRVIEGDPHVLDSMFVVPFAQLPKAEFTRLMLNRGMLLLMNQLSLTISSEPKERPQREQFVKYIFKAVLASVDAYLAKQDAYDPSYPKKMASLCAIDEPLARQLLPQYEMAFEGRFHPNSYDAFVQYDLPCWQENAIDCWLQSLQALERARLGDQMPDNWAAYASLSVDKGQSDKDLYSLLRNMAVTVKDYGVSEVMSHPCKATHYPRERVISALPLLLSSDHEHLALVADLFSMPAQSSWQSLAERCIALWRLRD